ncbi:MAG: VOC family protein [Acidobacteria bacterium]|jgi:catechol 2,3-dioxygenase-like lactoylglutathione lyase family enzyme|nr:VOC family protein [Acidobacteriota bacterium]
MTQDSANPGKAVQDAIAKVLPATVKLSRAVQIGVVVPNLEQTTSLLTSIFGIGPFHFIEWPNRPEAKYYYRGTEQKIRIKQAFVQLGALEVEFIQPIEGEENDYKKFLDRTGGGIHHVLFEVPDIEVVLQEVAKVGIEILQAGTGIRPGTRWALLDTQKQVGFLVELRHRPGNSDGASIS